MNKSIAVAMVGCCMTLAAASASAQMSDIDKQFITTASQSDYTEITFSKLAATQATNPQVKAYAQKMIDDHTKLETEMKPFADKAGVTPVMELDSTHQQKYDALKAMNGMDFDKAYMMGMDEDHHVALDLFKKEELTATPADFKATVAKGEKVVAMHTKMADMAVKKMDSMKGMKGMSGM